ncbi:tetratricopeptide repeat protein [Actinomycetota bacterium]
MEKTRSKKPKRALKVIIIIISVIIVLGTAVGLYWYRGERLTDSAQDAYYNGNPVEALSLYRKIEKQYPYPWWFLGDFAEWVPYRARQLRDYVYACSLKDNGNIKEAIVAYELFLDNHGGGWALYESLTLKALVELKMGLAQDLYNLKDYEGSIEVYNSIMELNILKIPVSEITEPLEEWEKTYLNTKSMIEDTHTEIAAIVPDIYVEWINELEKNKAFDTAIEKCHIALENSSFDFDRIWIEDKIIDLYNGWALQLKENKKYEESIEKLKVILIEYSDTSGNLHSIDRIAEIYSLWATQLREDEKYQEAINKYETILNEYPNIETIKEIELTLKETQNEYDNWKAETKALPVIEFNSELSRNEEDKWIVITIFKETGGKIGYTLKGEGWIVDVEGNEYGTYGAVINRGEVAVSPGGEDDNDYWFEGDIFVDGFAIFTWIGEDENGHSIEIEEKIYLLP